MEAADALNSMRSKLEASFGKALTMMIVASASNVCNITTIGITKENFLRLAEAVCRDQRVVDMWGAAGAADAAVNWRNLVD